MLLRMSSRLLTAAAGPQISHVQLALRICIKVCDDKNEVLSTAAKNESFERGSGAPNIPLPR